MKTSSIQVVSHQRFEGTWTLMFVPILTINLIVGTCRRCCNAMRELLNQVGTLTAPVATAVTAQYSISYPTDTGDVKCRILPLNQTQILASLGNIPTETFQAWIDGRHTVAQGYQLTHNSITYEILSVESHGPHSHPFIHKVLLRRLMST